MAFRKKAALDVSINSIVVIVFAITMLSIGLLFIRNYFTQAQSLINLEKEPDPASQQNPITLAYDPYKVELSKEYVFKVNVYNTRISPAPSIDLGLTGCKNSAGVDPANLITFTTSPLTITAGTYKTFEATLQVQPGMATGKHICTISAKNGNTVMEDRQMILEVS